MPSAAAACRTTRRDVPAGTGVRSSAKTLSVGAPDWFEVRNQRALKPGGHRDGLGEQRLIGDRRARGRISITWSPAGIASGSVLRSGWNVGSANVPSR